MIERDLPPGRLRWERGGRRLDRTPGSLAASHVVRETGSRSLNPANPGQTYRRRKMMHLRVPRIESSTPDPLPPRRTLMYLSRLSSPLPLLSFSLSLSISSYQRVDKVKTAYTAERDGGRERERGFWGACGPGWWVPSRGERRANRRGRWPLGRGQTRLPLTRPTPSFEPPWKLTI